MEFSITALSPETAKAGCVVVGVYGGNAAGKELTPPARRIDQAARGALHKALADLQGKTGSTLLLRGLPGVAAERVLLVSLGARKEFGAARFRDAVRGAAGALLELVDRTSSAAGGRLVRDWLRRPLVDPVAIAMRHDAVGELTEQHARATRVRDLLGRIPDFERLAGRAVIGTLTPREAAAFARKHGLKVVEDLGAKELTQRFLIGSDGKPDGRMIDGHRILSAEVP